MRRFVLGDVHGEYDKLVDILKKAEFNHEEDLLISLGDICDRGPKTYECIEELLKIRNTIFIRGNHDSCFMDSIKTSRRNMLFDQGGRETMESYNRNCDCQGDATKIPFEHIQFFFNQKMYHVTEDNILFVHGGINRHYPIEDQTETVLLWDRDFFLQAMSFKAKMGKIKVKGDFKHIYIGHTPTIYWDKDVPITAGNIVTNMDTGCGKGPYPLSMMNIDTREVFQSFKKQEEPEKD